MQSRDRTRGGDRNRRCALSPALGEVVTDRLLKSLAQQTGDNLDGLRRQFTTEQKTKEIRGDLDRGRKKIVAEFNKTVRGRRRGRQGLGDAPPPSIPALNRQCHRPHRASPTSERCSPINSPEDRNAADLWLGHPDRNQFLNGVTFDPTRTETGRIP